MKVKIGYFFSENYDVQGLSPNKRRPYIEAHFVRYPDIFFENLRIAPLQSGSSHRGALLEVRYRQFEI